MNVPRSGAYKELWLGLGAGLYSLKPLVPGGSSQPQLTLAFSQITAISIELRAAPWRIPASHTDQVKP